MLKGMRGRIAGKLIMKQDIEGEVPPRVPPYLEDAEGFPLIDRLLVLIILISPFHPWTLNCICSFVDAKMTRPLQLIQQLLPRVAFSDLPADVVYSIVEVPSVGTTGCGPGIKDRFSQHDRC